jgi:hypothetical protein
LNRGQFWQAASLLDDLRLRLMELFATSRGELLLLLLLFLGSLAQLQPGQGKRPPALSLLGEQGARGDEVRPLL